jgi:hypothetical protein
MLTVYALALANVSVAMAVGGPLNALLLWAILRETPAELRPFARLIAQTAVIDLLLLGVTFTLLPVSIKNKYLFYIK